MGLPVFSRGAEDSSVLVVVRIVYGVSGEGSGHSSRARVVLEHLLASGHEIKVVSYDQGYANLSPDFDVVETEGLHIATSENRVSVVKTFTENLSRLSDGIRRLKEVRAQCFREFRPHAVLTDFEPMTAYLADHYDLPLVSIDNQHRMRYMAYPKPAHLAKDALVTETVIRAMVPRPDVSLVTTFFFGEVKNERTFLFPPILRREVRELAPERGEHVLVYFTQAFDSFLDLLRGFERERFVVYGYDRAETDGNLAFERKSRAGFLEHLRTAKAVVATAGFTLITESLQLGKPYLALPMAGQFEQELNAHLLDEGGYGKNGRGGGAEAVGDFLYRLPAYEERLAGYPRSDDAALFAKLDELLDDGAREALASRARREARK